MEKLGVSNYTHKKLDKLLRFAEIILYVCQVEMHPMWRNDAVLDYCNKNGIQVTAYSPLGSQGTKVDLLHDPTVQKVSRKLNKTPGRVNKVGNREGNKCHPQVRASREDQGKHGSPYLYLGTLNNFLNQKRVVTAEELLLNKDEGPYRNVSELWDDVI